MQVEAFICSEIFGAIEHLNGGCIKYILQKYISSPLLQTYWLVNSLITA